MAFNQFKPIASFILYQKIFFEKALKYIDKQLD